MYILCINKIFINQQIVVQRPGVLTPYPGRSLIILYVKPLTRHNNIIYFVIIHYSGLKHHINTILSCENAFGSDYCNHCFNFAAQYDVVLNKVPHWSFSRLCARAYPCGSFMACLTLRTYIKLLI